MTNSKIDESAVIIKEGVSLDDFRKADRRTIKEVRDWLLINNFQKLIKIRDNRHPIGSVVKEMVYLGNYWYLKL